jgi:hypothetical protein
MSQLAKSEFQADWFASEDSAFRRARIVGPFVALAAAVLVAVIIIAESRLTPEQRIGMFEASHPYP